MANVSSSSSCAFYSPNPVDRSSRKIILFSMHQFSNNNWLVINLQRVVITYLKHMQQCATRPPPLHQWDIRDARDLPKPDSDRKITDVCPLIFGVLFGLVIFIVAVAVYSSANLQRASYPTDSLGKVCMLDTNTGVNNYPFVYFNDLTNPTADRHCLADCPETGVAAKCYDSCALTYYPNTPVSNRLGSFCLPTDPTLRSQLLASAGLSSKFNNIKALDYLLVGVGISFGLSIIWLLLVQFLPKAMFWVALLLAAVMLFIAMLVFLIGAGSTLVDGQGWAIIIGIVCLVLLVAVVLYAFLNRKQIYLAGCFLEVASESLKEHLSTLIWVPIFIALSFLFGWLLVFEYIAFASAGTPYLSSTGAIYYYNSNNWFGVLVLVVQGLWGLSFFRDSFSYMVTGLACEWYFKHDTHWYTPVSRYFCKNLGSVIGGSLLGSLFFLPSLITSILLPTADCCLCNLFDLARSDVYAWVYLSGNSFCASSRQTQYLCRRSAICRANESLVAVYTSVARVVLALAGVLIVYWIARDNLVDSRVPPHLLVGMFFVSLYVTCYCADVHALIGEAFLVCFLAQYDMESTQKQRKIGPQRLVDLITDVERQTEYGFPVPHS